MGFRFSPSHSIKLSTVKERENLRGQGVDGMAGGKVVAAGNGQDRAGGTKQSKERKREKNWAAKERLGFSWSPVTRRVSGNAVQWSAAMLHGGGSHDGVPDKVERGERRENRGRSRRMCVSGPIF